MKVLNRYRDLRFTKISYKFLNLGFHSKISNYRMTRGPATGRQSVHKVFKRFFRLVDIHNNTVNYKREAKKSKYPIQELFYKDMTEGVFCMDAKGGLKILPPHSECRYIERTY